jgi:hypothetical protein
MRYDSAINIGEHKRLICKNYAERQFDKWAKWSFEIKGEIRYKDVLKMQEKYGIYNQTLNNK